MRLFVGFFQLCILNLAIMLYHFIDTLRSRNELLFYYGAGCFAFAAISALLMWVLPQQVLGVSSMLKSLKFFLSTAIFVWSMAWYCQHLSDQRSVSWYSWALVVLFSIELVYIMTQGLRGLPSHFNVSTPFYAAMWQVMAVCALGISIVTLVIGLQFFKPMPQLPTYYLWGIRAGLVLFVIFSIQGMSMGARMAHTVGAADGGPGLPLTNWSTQAGDLRVAHFIGMHGLQVLPLLAYFVLRSQAGVVAAAIVYGGLSIFSFVQAMGGRPFFPWIK